MNTQTAMSACSNTFMDRYTNSSMSTRMKSQHGTLPDSFTKYKGICASLCEVLDHLLKKLHESMPERLHENPQSNQHLCLNLHDSHPEQLHKNYAKHDE